MNKNKLYNLFSKLNLTREQRNDLVSLHGTDDNNGKIQFFSFDDYSQVIHTDDMNNNEFIIGQKACDFLNRNLNILIYNYNYNKNTDYIIPVTIDIMHKITKSQRSRIYLFKNIPASIHYDNYNKENISFTINYTLNVINKDRNIYIDPISNAPDNVIHLNFDKIIFNIFTIYDKANNTFNISSNSRIKFTLKTNN